jgi:nucleosome binding factor SPN SPT16 subunit
VKLGAKGNNSVKDMTELCSYKSLKEMPKEAVTQAIFVDKAKNSILIPFSDPSGTRVMVPFHILTVKNASMNNENNVNFLRINFHTPGPGLAKDIKFPTMKESNALFIKELTIKSPSMIGISTALKNIRELLKKAKSEE